MPNLAGYNPGAWWLCANQPQLSTIFSATMRRLAKRLCPETPLNGDSTCFAKT